MKRLGLALAALLAAAPVSSALAQEPSALAASVIASEKEGPSLDSPRNFYIEVNGGKFRPAVDGQAGLTGAPYKDIFGRNQMWVFGLEFDWEIWKGFGTLAAGLATDYAVVYGHGTTISGKATSDITSLNTVPVRLLAVYRFDLLARRWSIPLVPFVKAGLAYTFWWVTNGGGGIAKNGTSEALGGKLGYQLAAGLALELNFIDPWLSRELDEEFGVNAVTLQAQFMRISADNFGISKGAMDLSANTWMFGLGFEF
ncbi:MAG TPA: MXAN_2562 family outer membrane beta-barrel protein [Myxococcales bacterium]|jgi:hypothetical protein